MKSSLKNSSKYKSQFKYPNIFKNIWVLFVLLLVQNKIYAQLQGSQWTFGDSAYIDFKNPENPILLTSSVRSRGSCSSIADSLGNLLFYCAPVSSFSNPQTECTLLFEYKFNNVYTKEHNVMENGNCIAGLGWYDEHTIIPMPGNDSLFYIFSVGGILEFGLFYQVIDMNANEGLGSVIDTDHSLLFWDEQGDDDKHLIYCLKTIRHANGKDWWLVIKAGGVPIQFYGEPNVYYLFLVTENGILEYTQNSIEFPEEAFPGCSLGFNQQGEKMFYICDNLGIYDFDRCTGELSNYQIIDSGGFNLDKFYWSAEFSQNGRYLYTIQVPKSLDDNTDSFYLLQYDLQQENPSQNKDTLFIFGPSQPINSSAENYSYIDIGALRLAPDNKIYTSQFYVSEYADWPWPDSIFNEVNMNLSVLNYPDSGYPACQFEPFSFGLGGKRTYGGLPNNPNYNLGVIDGSPCDTLGITGLKKGQSYLKNQFNIFPNPCHNFCVLEYKPAKNAGTILITDTQGKTVFKEENIPVTLLQHGYELNLSAFKSGVYTVVLTSGEMKVSSSFVRL